MLVSVLAIIAIVLILSTLRGGLRIVTKHTNGVPTDTMTVTLR